MTILLLAGTGEGRALAKFCAKAKLPVIASLAGVTRNPLSLDIPTRSGGFGDAAGFKQYLKSKNITAILDATHPFAHRITQRSFDIAKEMGIPFLLFERPAWTPSVNDRWIGITNESEAAWYIPPGSRVFLATGRQSLSKFKNLDNSEVICRQIEPPKSSFPWPNGRFHIGTPPFSEIEEISLFKTLSIDFLVVKNAGGVASRTKLDAARALGITVLMLARPKQSGALTVTSITDAQSWLNKRKF